MYDLAVWQPLFQKTKPLRWRALKGTMRTRDGRTVAVLSVLAEQCPGAGGLSGGKPKNPAGADNRLSHQLGNLSGNYTSRVKEDGGEARRVERLVEMGSVLMEAGCTRVNTLTQICHDSSD